jgi:hypothetical protein
MITPYSRKKISNEQTLMDKVAIYSEENARLLKLEKWCRDKAIPAFRDIIEYQQELYRPEKGTPSEILAKEALEALPE